MSDFYRRLDDKERNARIDRIFANRPENLHDYQGCANDAQMQASKLPPPADTSGYLSEDKKPIQPLSETQLWGSPAGDTASEKPWGFSGYLEVLPEPVPTERMRFSGPWESKTELCECGHTGYHGHNASPPNHPCLVPGCGCMAYRAARSSAPEAAAASASDDTFCNKLIDRTDQYVAAPIAPAAEEPDPVGEQMVREVYEGLLLRDAEELIRALVDALKSMLNLDVVREKSWLPGSYGEAVVAAGHECVVRAEEYRKGAKK